MSYSIPNMVQNGGGSAAPSRYIANNVRGNSIHPRLSRFFRRQKSSGWLITSERLKHGLPVVSSGGDDWLRPPRPARCRWRVASAVSIHLPAPDCEYSHFSGIERCGSIWVCPVCSAVIRAHRSSEIATALETAVNTALGITFLTLTLRHKKNQPLSLNLDAILNGWRKVQNYKSFKTLSSSLGVVGFIRAAEITYGENGWHPHLHIALITQQPLDPASVRLLDSQLSSQWARAVVSLGAMEPSDDHGVNILSVTRGTEKNIAQYLSKLQEKQNSPLHIAKELARGDMKKARGRSISPFDLLDLPKSDIRARDLWYEYFSVTRGRRAFSWSRGLRDLLLPDIDDLTDDEILDQTEVGDLYEIIPADVWDNEIKNDPEAMHFLLTQAESLL